MRSPDPLTIQGAPSNINLRGIHIVIKVYFILINREYIYFRHIMHIDHDLCFCKYHKCILVMILPFELALYSKGSYVTIWRLNILWNCLYRSTFFYNIIAQWSRALVLWTAHPEFKSDADFCKMLLKFFLKVIFLPKKWISICFLYIHICHMLLYFSSSNYFVLI